MNLDEEAARATEMLGGKVVSEVRRHRAEEVLVEFTDGARLYVDGRAGALSFLSSAVMKSDCLSV